MAEIPAAKVSECLGWQITDDKQIVLLGFKNDSSQTFNLALDEATLKSAIVALLHATGAFPKQKMEGGTNLLISTDWFEFGHAETGDDFLRLRLPSGGNLAFALPPGMTANMRDVLVSRLGPGSNTPTPASSHH
jgi:hypothetical protein